MTETFGQVATLLPGSPVERKAHPLPGVDIRIEDDGRIAVRGDQVSPGYLGEPDRLDPWFVTNDLGSIEADGALRVLGRSDNIIITGGENVSPEQVEAALRRHPRVGEVCVIGVDDEEWGQRLVGVFAGDIEPAELIEWAHGLLPTHMVPRSMRRVGEVPMLSIGKPDRRAVTSDFGMYD
jgi:O-succinylbenzoic acid--CoA ligase